MALQYADLIQKMTLEEKASLCSGHDFWHSEGVPRGGDSLRDAYGWTARYP